MPTLRSSKRLEEQTTLEESPPSQTANVISTQILDQLPRSLPRSRENSLLRMKPQLSHIFGVDEAGRGPLAGPVVAAAVWLPHALPGIVDSKQINCEHKRQVVYQQIIQSPNCRWAVAIVDAATIDEINILQATLLGMRLALQALVQNAATLPTLRPHASIDFPGTYVVVSSPSIIDSGLDQRLPSSACHAIIDGNQQPADLPCEAETMIKADGREYSVAAASLLAKVTRDQLLHAYEVKFPGYGLAQHKGYGTAQHVAALRRHGATPIHRWSFAPLKHWVSSQEHDKHRYRHTACREKHSSFVAIRPKYMVKGVSSSKTNRRKASSDKPAMANKLRRSNRRRGGQPDPK